jgi:hypothetical protein
MYLAEIKGSLCDLDDDLLARYGSTYQFDMTIVGSGALILLGVLPSNRGTTDIDVLEAPHEVIELLELYNMNTAVETFFYEYPQTWGKRRQRIDFESVCLNVFTMSLEDLTVLKLLAFRKRDQSDLKMILKSGQLSWNKLESLIDDPTELRVNLESEERWQEFLQCFDWLKQMRDGYEQNNISGMAEKRTRQNVR